MNKTKNSIAGIVIIGIVLFLGYTIWLISKPVPTEIQGEVEASEMKVASKLIGRIDSLPVKKGMSIKKGDLLFRIVSPEVTAKMNQAQGAQLAAEAQQLKASNGARPQDIQAAFNVYQKAKAAAEFARKTFVRIKNLHAEGVIPEQKRDEVETKMIAALETEKAAKAIWEKAKSGARLEDKKAAAALVKRAQGAVEEVQSYMNETLIFAPENGEIANIIAENGELVPAGFPVVSLVDLEDVWVTFNLREDYLAKIKMGSVFEARFPALGMKKVKLKVSYIHVQAAYANWNATKTMGDFDMKTFEVQARPVEKVDGLRPGMSALVNWDEVGQ
ncbi:HlyD family efflux transporter periplasmic adaptor subunit [Prolixibacteraceae bacterium JC049]|nr:HlyD family efflux transporter periplasmic adaptor subunit [Prolixibacteraceae bacterium JC049]